MVTMVDNPFMIFAAASHHLDLRPCSVYHIGAINTRLRPRLQRASMQCRHCHELEMVSSSGSEERCAEHTLHQVVVYLRVVKFQTVHKTKVGPANASIRQVGSG
jgi:hypothetical protein